MARLRTVLIECEDHGGIDPLHERLRRVSEVMKQEQLKLVRATDPAKERQPDAMSRILAILPSLLPSDRAELLAILGAQP